MQVHDDVSEERLRDVFGEFRGEIYQKPPLRASVKREPRKRTIYELDILEINGRLVLFECSCQAGTYVRKLCSDIGEVLGCGAHMQELRRTRAGPYLENDLVTLHQITSAQSEYEAGKENALRTLIKPMETALVSIPHVYIRDSAVDAICHGATLAIPGIVKLDSSIERNSPVAIFTLKGEAVALATSLLSTREILDQQKGMAAKTVRVIMDRGTYPPIWKH